MRLCSYRPKHLSTARVVYTRSRRPCRHVLHKRLRTSVNCKWTLDRRSFFCSDFVVCWQSAQRTRVRSAMANQRQFVDEVINAVNKCRAIHRVDPLRHNGAISAVAQNWANYMARTGRFQHNPDGNYNGQPLGENCALKWATNRQYYSGKSAMMGACITELRPNLNERSIDGCSPLFWHEPCASVEFITVSHLPFYLHFFALIPAILYKCVLEKKDVGILTIRRDRRNQ